MDNVDDSEIQHSSKWHSVLAKMILQKMWQICYTNGVGQVERIYTAMI
jgi:hypothetical protein